MRNAEHALLHFLSESGNHSPEKDTCLVIGASADLGQAIGGKPYYKTPYKSVWTAWQGLNATGFNPEDHQTVFDKVLIVADKQKQETLGLMALGLSRLTSDGQLVVALENDTGGKSLDKMLSAFGCPVANLSKHKSRVVWTNNPEKADKSEIEKSLKYLEPQKRTDGKWTQPGVFSWDRPDTGTTIFLEYMTEPLSGIGADFGCGIGDITWKMLQTYPEIRKMYVLDHDQRALTCANLNFKAFEGRTEPLWMDITTETPPQNLDFIVMNPPFHKGKDESITLGLKFINKAVQSLKSNGKLYMVANVHLPYEDVMKSAFRHIEILGNKSGFKVLRAIK